MSAVLDTPATARTDTSSAGGVRELIALALPVILTNLSSTLMMTTDAVMVGRLGATELGAVGYAGIWYWTVIAGFNGTGTGVQTFVAQAQGAGRARTCGAWLWQAWYTVVPIAVVMMMLFATAFPALLELLGPDKPLRPLAQQLRAGARVRHRRPDDRAGRGVVPARRRRYTHAALRHDRRQPGQRGAQLLPDLRPLRVSADGRRRLGSGDRGRGVGLRRVAVDGGPAGGRAARVPHRARGAGLVGDAPLPSHQRADRRPVGARHAGLRVVQHDRRAHGRERDGGEPGAAQPDAPVVHAGRRRADGGGDDGRALRRRRRPARRAPEPRQRHACRRRPVRRRRRAVHRRARSVPAAVRRTTRRCCAWARRCCSSARRS